MCRPTPPNSRVGTILPLLAPCPQCALNIMALCGAAPTPSLCHGVLLETPPSLPNQAPGAVHLLRCPHSHPRASDVSLTCQRLLVVLAHGDEVPQAGVELLHDGLEESREQHQGQGTRRLGGLNGEGKIPQASHAGSRPRSHGRAPGPNPSSAPVECPWANDLPKPQF